MSAMNTLYNPDEKRTSASIITSGRALKERSGSDWRRGFDEYDRLTA